MKYLLLFLCLFLGGQTSLQAQKNDMLGKIVLNPYVAEGEEYSPQVRQMLYSKLMQIATQGGMAGSGFDDRFVITAHAVPVNKELTGTIPQKTAVRLNLTVYIGDGFDGTLYSSHTVTLTGIGNNESLAYNNAIKKLSPSNAELQKSVSLGKQRIVDYYDRMSGDILHAAKAEAKGGRYDEAIIKLLAIPSSCKAYSEAQQLIGEYGRPAAQNANMELVQRARAAWSASPTEEGAARAQSILAQLSYPSQSVLNAAKSLTDDIAARLQKDRDAMWALLAQQLEHENEQQLARIESQRDQNIASIQARAEVEKAYASRPKVVYHVHWW